MREPELETIPWKCEVCHNCRLVVKGRYGCAPRGRCVAGGPYLGYMTLSEEAVQGYSNFEQVLETENDPNQGRD